MTIFFYCPLCIRAFIDCVSHWSYKSPSSVCTLRVSHWCLMGCKLSTACLYRICCCTQYCTDLYTHCTPHCTSHFQCTVHTLYNDWTLYTNWTDKPAPRQQIKTHLLSPKNDIFEHNETNGQDNSNVEYEKCVSFS